MQEQIWIEWPVGVVYTPQDRFFLELSAAAAGACLAGLAGEAKQGCFGRLSGSTRRSVSCESS